MKVSRKKIGYYKSILSPLHQLVSRVKDVDDNGNGYCITCNTKMHFAQPNKANGWHCIDRKFNGTLYEPRNCHLQCTTCNGKVNKWEQWLHAMYIDNRYWEWTFLELHHLAKNPPKLRPRELCQLIITRTAELEIHLNRIKKSRVPERIRKQLKYYQNRAKEFKEILDLHSQ